MKAISISDIRKAHPFGVSSTTDRDYTNIANTLFSLLRTTPFCVEHAGTEIRQMAIRLTLYFEDIVSEIGLWKSFVSKHQELYAKPIPFFETTGDYDTDDIHLEDIRLLLWDATLDDEYSETLVNPENIALEQAARVVYAYLDELFEDTPINDVLYNFFHEARFTGNFYEVRQVLKWYFFDCYLTSGRFKDSTFEDALKEYTELCQGNKEVGQSTAEAAIAFDYPVGPLALKPQEWLSILLGIHGHETQAILVRDIFSRQLEPYRLAAYDAKVITLRNIDNEEMPLQRTEYFKVRNSILKDSEVNGCVGRYSRYGHQWYLNGMNSWGDVTTVFAHTKKDKEEMKKNTFADLANAGSLLAKRQLFFFETAEACTRFYQDELKMPHAPSLPKGVRNVMLYIPNLHEGKICTIMNCAEYIKSPHNPMYDREKSKTHFLVANLDYVPGEFIRYAIRHNLMPDFALQSNHGYRHGRKLAQSNLDFLARTLRRHEY